MGTGKPPETLRKLLLYRLSRLVRALYPTAVTQNPYRDHSPTAYYSLDAEDQLLFEDLLHSITVLNGYGRLTGSHELVSTRSDFLSALQLVLPRELQLTPRMMDVHEQLQSVYGDQPFTYMEACSRLKLSRTSLKRLLKPLLFHRLMVKYKPQSGQVRLRVVATDRDYLPTIFDQIHEPWRDYQSFTEF